MCLLINSRDGPQGERPWGARLSKGRVKSKERTGGAIRRESTTTIVKLEQRITLLKDTPRPVQPTVRNVHSVCVEKKGPLLRANKLLRDD